MRFVDKSIRVSVSVPRASQGVGGVRAKRAVAAVAGASNRVASVASVGAASGRENAVEGETVAQPCVAVRVVVAARRGSPDMGYGRGTFVG